MTNYINSEGGTFRSVVVGGGIRSEGDVTTQYGSINNSRQIITITSGKTITICCSILSAGGGGVVLADYISARILMPGYSNTSFPMYVKQTMKYELVFGTANEDQLSNMITSSVIKENDILKITLTHTNKYSVSNGLQLEYTAGITTVTVN